MTAFDVAPDPSFGLHASQGTCTLSESGAASLAGKPHTPEIIAFHGSPHDFDRFDITQIDYSDGCKTYGYGLYFAERESVAQWYQEYDREVKGSIYKVRIKVDPEQLLDWDKPLNEQSPFVKAGLQKIVDERFNFPGLKIDILPQSPEAFYWTLMLIAAAGENETAFSYFHKIATRYLQEQGIRGALYLDGFSREVGQGTRNYVLFDDNDVEITHKNGEPVVNNGALKERPPAI